ncbi:MAG: SDR family oxidoreductase [Candidatus Nanopelagicales bacterium]
MPDDLLGEMVVACIVPIEGTELSAAEIIAFVKQEIASFKVPRRVLFFTDGDYALTGNKRSSRAPCANWRSSGWRRNRRVRPAASGGRRTMEGRLNGKVIVVAGAGGIGDELARRYASEGASVVLGDIDSRRAIGTAEAFSGAGLKVAGTRLDGADGESIAAIVSLAQSRFGGLDGFHANYAGFNEGNSLNDVTTIPMDDFDEVWNVSARGFVLCTRHADPGDAEARRWFHRLYEFGRCLHGRGSAAGLCDEQGRAHGAGPPCRAAVQSAGHPRQCDLPRRCFAPKVRGAYPGGSCRGIREGNSRRSPGQAV